MVAEANFSMSKSARIKEGYHYCYCRLRTTVFFCSSPSQLTRLIMRILFDTETCLSLTRKLVSISSEYGINTEITEDVLTESTKNQSKFMDCKHKWSSYAIYW
jgi:hypothetical protein